MFMHSCVMRRPSETVHARNVFPVKRDASLSVNDSRIKNLKTATNGLYHCHRTLVHVH